MNIIVAVDKNWAIGYKGELLARISADLKNFKAVTSGNIVILGRKTLETFPKQKPLPNRVNIILSRKEGYKVEGAKVVKSVEDAIKEAEKHADKEVFIIGGSSVYEQFLPYCKKAYVTKIDKAFENADSYFENLDEAKDWKLVEEGETLNEESLNFNFNIYERI